MAKLGKRQAIVLAPGAGRSYPMGRISAVFKADGAESASRYSISEWWLEPNCKGVPHAFLVLSESARILALQTPGSGETFYRAASEPAGEGSGRVDFAKIGQAAKNTGVTAILGPPPFKKR